VPEQFLNDPEDVKWLLETHLAHFGISQNTQLIKSFVLVGNEDCPQRVLCYLTTDPQYTIHPFVTYRYNSETRQLEEE
jgi:hypothetical protein